MSSTGGRYKRVGIDIEDTGEFVEIVHTGEGRAVYDWQNPGDANTSFKVVQTGNLLSFFEGDLRPYSLQHKSFTVDLSAFEFNSDFADVDVKMVDGYGYLIVVSPSIEPFYIEYDPDLDTVTATQLTLKIRDFDGVDDGLDIDEKPTTLSAEHEYNLKNQGWDDTKIAQVFTDLGYYPPNSWSWTYGKDSSDNFSTSILAKQYFGSSAAAKGHYILDYFVMDRDGIGTSPKNIRPSSVAFMAGRIFYLVGDTLLFSQTILESIKNAEKCYQDADPTSEIISDLVETDGGVITLLGIGQGEILEVIGAFMFAGGTKSSWSISGVEATFNAKGYTVKKIIDSGVVGPKVAAAAGSQLYYFGTDSIYAVAPNDVTLSLAATSISDNLIKSYYEDLTEEQKSKATAVYDASASAIKWYMNDGTILVYDLRVQGYNVLKVSQTEGLPILSAVTETSKPSRVTPKIDMLIGTELVYVGTEKMSYTEIQEDYSKITNIVHLCEINGTFSFAEFNSREFLDWYIADPLKIGTSYDAYMVGFPYAIGDFYRSKKIVYLGAVMLRTEEEALELPSSCKAQVLWDWTSSSDTGRWSEKQELYRPTQVEYKKYKYVNTKTKLRGIGKSMQIRIDTEAGKDCRLEGLSIVAAGVGYV